METCPRCRVPIPFVEVQVSACPLDRQEAELDRLEDRLDAIALDLIKAESISWSEASDV